MSTFEEWGHAGAVVWGWLFIIGMVLWIAVVGLGYVYDTAVRVRQQRARRRFTREAHALALERLEQNRRAAAEPIELRLHLDTTSWDAGIARALQAATAAEDNAAERRRAETGHP